MIYETKRNDREAESVHHKMILDKTGRVKTKESDDNEDKTDRRPASRGVWEPRETT